MCTNSNGQVRPVTEGQDQYVPRMGMPYEDIPQKLRQQFSAVDDPAASQADDDQGNRTSADK